MTCKARADWDISQVPPEVMEVFSYWQQELGYYKRSINWERDRTITARLKSFTVAQLKRVVDIVKNDAWWRGKNNRNTPYDDIINIFRNDTRVEQFLRENPTRESPDLFATQDYTTNEEIGF